MPVKGRAKQIAELSLLNCVHGQRLASSLESWWPLCKTCAESVVTVPVTVMRQAFVHQPNIVPEEKFAQDQSAIEDADFAAAPWISLGDALNAKEDWHGAADAYRKGLAIRSHRESRKHALTALNHCVSMIAAEDAQVE